MAGQGVPRRLAGGRMVGPMRILQGPGLHLGSVRKLSQASKQTHHMIRSVSERSGLL
jgi:hypothetical protein